MIQDTQFNTLIGMLQKIASPLNGYQNILDNIDQSNQLSEVQIAAIQSILDSQVQLCAIYQLDRINLINKLKRHMIEQRRNLKERKLYDGLAIIQIIQQSYKRKEGVAIINQKGEYIFLDGLTRSILGIRKSQAFDITINHKLTEQSLLRLKEFFNSKSQHNPMGQEIELELIIHNSKSQKKYLKQVEKEIQRMPEQAQIPLNSAQTVKNVEFIDQQQSLFKTVSFKFSRIDVTLSDEFIEATKETNIMISPKVQFKQVIQGVLLQVQEKKHELIETTNDRKPQQMNKAQKKIKPFGE